MAATQGINHLGLTVRDLDQTTAFFTDCLGWDLSARDDAYPRTTVTDGTSRLTLWQADTSGPMTAFDRRANIGLHHVAFEIPTLAAFQDLAVQVQSHPGVMVEFMPEPMGAGPRQHMMLAEPGGLRIELVWPGT